MIARLWHGATRAEDAEAYTALVGRTGMADFKKTPGNRGAMVLRTISGSRADFLVISFWESMDAIRAFSGPDVEKARYYPEDPEFLLEMEPGVQHYEVALGKP
jgi:heme-degrading monooxygenase HmoA